jgi:SAM-dependent methyltransferase
MAAMTWTEPSPRPRPEPGQVEPPGARAQAQVRLVERLVSLEPRSRILDLACGGGRPTLELARRGHRVLGIDHSEEPLAEARRVVGKERLNVHFLHTDIRRISYRGEFDLVVNLFAAVFGLPDDHDHLRVLEGVRRGLKPGGRLILDLLNKEWLVRHPEAAAAFDFETGRLSAAGPGLRVYALTELKALLESAGLALLKVVGGYEGEPYGADSPRMIVLAQRPEETTARRPAEGLISTIRIKGRGRSR